MNQQKVLFVASGNLGKAKILVERQANSLIKQGFSVDFYLIKGKGVFGYVKNILPLRKAIKSVNYEIIHAHYSYSAFVASLAGARNLSVSLMGSDLRAHFINIILIRIFKALFSWYIIIVKSEDMAQKLCIKDSKILPNGVDTGLFYPLDKEACQNKLGWTAKKKHILFPANPSRPEKNFILANQIYSRLTIESEIHTLNNVDPSEMPVWMNASDVILLTSLWEGSPNVIKEAMACGKPVVCTDVGDVRWLFGKEPGHYLISNDLTDAIRKLEDALMFSSQNAYTRGRERIVSLGLDSESIALKIIEIYSRVK